jgi:hypothetical protein
VTFSLGIDIQIKPVLFPPRFFAQQPMSLPVHDLPDIMTA